MSASSPAAKSAREAQAVRDRFLGRNDSVVDNWMRLIAEALPNEKKAIGRHANQLKRMLESRWTAFIESGVLSAQPAAAAGTIDVTLPGRQPTLGRRHP